MNLIQRIKAAANIVVRGNLLPTVVNPINGRGPAFMMLNDKLVIYPYGKDQTFIENGYQKNWAVYVVVNKCVKKFRQVPFYHYTIKTKERKTWFDEYIPLSKAGLGDHEVRELRKMRAKSVEQTIVDSRLSKFLNKPNRNHSGSKFRGQLYGHKLLTGEGDHWFSYPLKDNVFDLSQPPLEAFPMPKANIALIKGNSPWTIDGYKLLIGGDNADVPKQSVILWTFDTYGLDPITLNHLRGQAPLDAGLLTMQGVNEAEERLATMSKNQGVSAIAYNETAMGQPTVEQAMFMRQQFNSVINDRDLAGSIAVMNGKWGFHQVGLDARALQLIEQGDKGLDKVAMIMDVPIGLFRHGTTYENKPQDKKDFIYDNIAPAAYELRDQWNELLLPQFNLDRERNVIDCDILSLPELAADQEKVSKFLDTMGPRLTLNEGRELLGYERSPDPNLDKHYATSGLTPLDQINEPIGGSLDAEMSQLND
jgi:phage portal protein BeeE